MAERNLSIRISVQDAATAKLALEQFGKDGKAALRAIEAGAAPASAGLLRLGETAGKLRESLRTAVEQAASFRTIIGTLAGTTGVGLLLRNALDWADALQDSADKLGINVEALQELRFAAQQTGIEADKLDQILTIFADGVANAAKGSGQAVDALHRLGVPLKDLQGNIRPIPDLLLDVADALQKVANPAERINLGRDLFGRDGAAFLNTLANGSQGLKEFFALARQVGAVMAEDLVKKAADASDKLDALGASLKTSFNTGLIDGFKGSFQKIADLMTDPAFQQGARDLGENLGKLLRFAVEHSDVLIRIFGVLAGGLTGSRVGGLYGGLAGTAAGGFLPEIIGAGGSGRLPGPNLEQQITALEAKRTALQGEAEQLEVKIQELQKSGDEAGLKAAAARAEQVLARGEAIAAQLKELHSIVDAPGGTVGRGTRAGVDAGSVATPKSSAAATREETAALDQLLQSMRDENALLGQTGDAREREQALVKASAAAQRDYDAGLRDSPLLTGDEVDAINGLVDARQRQAMADEEAKALQAELADSEREIAQVHDQVRTSAERYADAQAHLNQLLAEGLSREDYDRAVKQLADQYDTAAKEIENVFDQAFDRIGSAITQTMATGKLDMASFGDLAKAVFSEIEQELIKLALINPIKNWLSGGNLPTLGGVLGDIFGGGSSGAINPKDPSLAGASSGGSSWLGDVGDWIGSIFHDGGVVGGPAPMRLVPAAAWIGAPRFHQGGGPGLAPGEVAAVLRRGETVRTPEQEAALGKGKTTVVVNNYSSEQATTRRRQDAQGNELIEVMIGHLVSDVRTNGALSREIGRSFGLNRAPGARR
jgi:hypothetical protein